MLIAKKYLFTPSSQYFQQVGVPLSMLENASDSDSDGDMVDPDLFMQQLDVETSGALP